MSTTRLPELPEARIESYQTDGTMRTTKLTTYDEFDMHAYGLAVWKAAMERAVDAVEDDVMPGRSAEYRAGYVVALRTAVAAIKDIPLPEQGSQK